MLRYLDFSLPFLVQKNTSETGLGTVLSQIINRDKHPMMFANQKLTPVERCYATVERKVLVIKWIVEELHYYLTEHHFMLITNHAPLQWMSQAKDTNSQVIR